MATRVTRRIRLALLGVFALLVAMLVGPSVSAQIGRPQMPQRPGMPGGAGGGGPVGPPGMPGGGGGGFTQPGMPGGADRGFGRPAMPAMPEMPKPPEPRMPDIPRMPDFPRPGNLFETVWKCGKCQAELGRGSVKPAVNSCPHCGVNFINGGGFGPFTPPAVNTPDPPRVNVPRFDFNDGGNNWQANAAEDTETQLAKQKEKEKAFAIGAWTVVGIVGAVGILLVVAVVLIAILASSNKKRKPAAKRVKKRPRRYEYDDEDEDDDDDYQPRRRRRYD